MQEETSAFLEVQRTTSQGEYSHLVEQSLVDECRSLPRQISSPLLCRQTSIGGLFRDETDAGLRASIRGQRVFLYKFLGQLDFLNGDRHVDRFQTMLASEPKAVVISLENVPWIDPDGIEALKSMVRTMDNAGVEVFLASARPKVEQALNREEWYQEKTARDRRTVFTTMQPALLAAVGGAPLSLCL